MTAPATATKTSLANIHFVIMASASHALLMTEHAASGPVEESMKNVSRIKD